MHRFSKRSRLIATGLLVLGWLLLFRPASLGGPAGYVLVTGVSMEPTIHDGDLVMTQKQHHYEIGDIVAYEVDNRIVIHRIVGGSAEEGFVMQGDNKDSADPWQPNPADVLGKRWMRIPGMGRKVRDVKDSPVALGAAGGGLGGLAFAGQRRRRRRRPDSCGLSTTAPRLRRQSASPSAPSSASTRLFALGGAAILLTAATAATLTRPSDRIEQRTQVGFTHHAGFEFTAAVQPSTLYEAPTLSSRSLPTTDTEAGGKQVGPPLYTNLLRGLNVDFGYRLEGRLAGSQGRLSAELEVRAGRNGWVKTFPVLDTLPFEGNAASTTIPIDLARVRSLIDAVERETGTSSGTYQLVVTPRVEVTGRQAGHLVDEVYAPEFSMKLNDANLIVDGERAQTKPVEQQTSVRVANDLKLLGVSVAPAAARATTVGGLVFLLVLGGIYGASMRKHMGHGEIARIRLRYGSLIVPLTGEVPNGVPHSEVTSMNDLVRLARRSEQLVFHHEPAPGDHRFFVPDGGLTYEYRLPGGEHQA